LLNVKLLSNLKLLSVNSGSSMSDKPYYETDRGYEEEEEASFQETKRGAMRYLYDVQQSGGRKLLLRW
jgi:hypothetical protein